MGQSSMMETEKITGLGEGPGGIGAWMLGRCGLREWREPSDGHTERRQTRRACCAHLLSAGPHHPPLEAQASELGRDQMSPGSNQGVKTKGPPCYSTAMGGPDDCLVTKESLLHLRVPSWSPCLHHSLGMR